MVAQAWMLWGDKAVYVAGVSSHNREKITFLNYHFQWDKLV